MPYMIDGHNLIGKVADIDLADPQDEARLIQHLRRFCLRTGSKAVVYFDGAAPGAPKVDSRAGLQVRFVPRPQTADEAMAAHLGRLAGEAPNWTVVTSDLAVVELARRARSRTMSSAAFASLLEGAAHKAEPSEKPEPPEPDEVETWLRLFENRRG